MTRNICKIFSCIVFLITICISGFSQQTKNEQIYSSWRSPNRDGIYNETGLLKSWQAEGPNLLWAYEELGEGYSSVAIDGEYVFTTGMIDSTGYLFKFNTKGELIWKKGYGPEWKVNYPGTRSTPLIVEQKIIIYSGQGGIYCMDKTNGTPIWNKNLIEEGYGQQIVWGVTENPVVVNNKLIIAPGGEVHNVIALDINSGELIWTTKALGEKSCYGSPAIVKLAERTLYVNHIGQNLIGVDISNGEFLWNVAQENKYVIHPNTPIYKNGHLFTISGLKFGSQKLKLSNDGKTIESVWKNDSLDNFMGGAVLYNNYIYASAHKYKKWRVISWDTGEELFQTNEIKGNGVTILADGMLYCYSDKGFMALVKPLEGKMELVSQFKITKGSAQHWAHPVISNGVLYVRHGNALMAYDIKK